MKAAIFHEHGPIENLRYEDIPEPDVGSDECLLKVKAVALNGFDPMILRGIPGLKIPLPMVPGGDIVGEIFQVGVEVDNSCWKIGQRVQIMPNQGRSGMMGETRWGGASEYVTCSQEYLIPIPDEVSDIQAACLPVAYSAAHRMMLTRGKIQKDEKILILSAASGVGTCCVQLAKQAGCHVIAVASSDEKLEKLIKIGADHTINSSTQDVVEEVINRYGKPKIWGGGGVDVLVNYTGGDTWAQTFRAVTRQGRILVCGATAGYNPKTDLRYIWSFEFNIIGCNGWDRNDLEKLLELVADGSIEPVVHSVRPLADIRQSMQELSDRKVVGKVILIP